MSPQHAGPGAFSARALSQRSSWCPPRRAVWGAWLAMLGAAMGSGCTCGKSIVTTSDQCTGASGLQADKAGTCGSNDECADHYLCKEPKDKPGVKCCVFADRACATEADCCPGDSCLPTRKVCFDQVLACKVDADCGDRGDRFCQPYTDTYGSSLRCRFKTCGPHGECAEGLSCFQGECMADLPCNGTCPSGAACVPSNDTCQDYKSPTGRTAAACPMTCAPGFIGTFNDSRNIWDACNLPAVKCVCAELPPLTSNDFGRFSAIAALPGQALFVSAYDGQYGDLVVVKYGLDGKRLATEYVDGVPQGAAVKYGPSGARGGVVEPGSDVGRYTDVAVAANGRVFVSYYDVTNGDLKVAVRGADNTWTSHQVDGATGDVGLYTSIGLDSAGRPGVSYFQRAAESGFDVSQCPAPKPTGPVKYITALKYAHAKSATPTSAADWVVKTVSCLERPPPPCDLCGASEVCADPGSGAGCFATATTCTPACDAAKQACVTVNGAAQCAKKTTVTPLADVPLGVGLFTSLTFRGDEAVIVAARRTAASAKATPVSQLIGTTVNGQDTVGALVVLDATGDTGYFPDVKLDPANNAVGIAYHDLTTRTLKYYAAPQLQTGVTPQVIDTGVDTSLPGNPSFVGTDSALVFTGAGKVMAVYQDSTRGDLRVARREPTWAVDPPVTTSGAVGFFADAVLTDGKVYATHARLRARMVHNDPRVDNTLLLEQLSP